VRASIRPSVQKGRIVGITGLLTDITEQKALSAQLRQAQKMEAIGLMAGGVAHDFNNLLQAMTTEIGLLCARADDPRAVATHGLELDESVRRGALLTRQLLLFSRQQTAEPVPLDLNEVIAQTIAMLRRMVRDDVKLVMVLGDGALPVVADRGQLDQVLMNLVLNSSDAMPQGGTITVRSGRHAGRAWFSVADTGSGIPAEIRERIFEPFFTTKTTGKGSGLGLAVVHGIVAHHAGTIGVESELDVGTTFTITLPAVSRSRLAAAKVETPAAPVSLEGRGERVLLVEDEDGARQGLAEILAMLGYEVLALPNGEEAGTLPNDPAFDLVISDLFLPGIAGPPLVAGLRDRWPGLKVILMSGYAEEDVLRSALCAGKVRFLQKPFDIDTLAREIRLALGEPSTSS
jgi:two-component system cell cycle sensor histidine kinase/response regulator CckA